MKYKYNFEGLIKIRLQDFDFSTINNIETKSQWKKMIKNKLVIVNGEKSTLSTWVMPGNTLEILWDLYKSQPTKVFPLKLDVLYEDDYLAIVNKPSGLPVSGNVFKSLQNSLSTNLSISNKMSEGDSFQTCHRLDFSTSGLVIVSKTKTCRVLIGELFLQKKIDKNYYALLQGELEFENGVWNTKIENKRSESKYQCLKTVPSLQNGFLTLVKLSPLTGRTHQLRIHAANNGSPIVGDVLYGKEGNIFKGKGLFLCAYNVSFIHPVTHALVDVKIPIPNKFEKLLAYEERRYYAHNKL